MSQLRRHSRSSDSALRHFCSRAHTLTLSVNLQTTYFFYTCVDLAITSLFRPLLKYWWRWWWWGQISWLVTLKCNLTLTFDPESCLLVFFDTKIAYNLRTRPTGEISMHFHMTIHLRWFVSRIKVGIGLYLCDLRSRRIKLVEHADLCCAYPRHSSFDAVC